MADKNDDVLQDLLDPKKLLEQLRECETKQFKNAIDLLQECEERHRRNEKKLSRLTIASSAGAAIIGKEAAEEVGTYVTTVESILTGDVGAISDAADGAGVNLVILPSDRSAGLTDVVRHVAAGAAESLSLMRARNLARIMREIKERGIFLVGTSDQAKVSLYDANFTGSVGLVMGAEGTGIRRLTADLCDQLIQIPMDGSVECLNVSVATGVCLFEAKRQRLN